MSTSSFTLISSIVEKTFPAISNRVIPLLLLQKDRSPFSGNGRMMSFPHSSGVLSLHHISLHMRSNHSLMLFPPSFSSSGGMLSIPGVVPFQHADGLIKFFSAWWVKTDVNLICRGKIGEVNELFRFICIQQLLEILSPSFET